MRESPGSHPTTLVDALEALAGVTDRGFTFIGYDGLDTVVSFAALRDRAVCLDSGLRARGVRPGDRVALVLPRGISETPTRPPRHFARGGCSPATWAIWPRGSCSSPAGRRTSW